MAKSLEAAYICERSKSVAQQYGFKILSYNNHILRIAVENHLLSQEIEFNKIKIISQINDLLGQETIGNLKYSIGEKKIDIYET